MECFKIELTQIECKIISVSTSLRSLRTNADLIMKWGRFDFEGYQESYRTSSHLISFEGKAPKEQGFFSGLPFPNLLP